METSKEEVGRRIKAAITATGITQRAVAKSLNLTEGTISNYVNGVSEPSASGYATLARLCKTTTDWLITGKGPGPGEDHSHVNENQSSYSHHTGGVIDEALATEVWHFLDQVEEVTGASITKERRISLFIKIYNRYAVGEQVGIKEITTLIRDMG